MQVFIEDEHYFGVDLGNSGIRLVELKQIHDKPTLVTYGDIELPPGIMSSDAPVDQQRVADVMKQLASDARVSTKNVVAGLPASKVFASIVKMPQMSEADIAHSIRYQADKYIPMPLDQVKLDFTKITQDKTAEEIDVLLVATPTVVANKYLNIFQLAGLELMALDVNAIAQARAMVPAADIDVVLVDFTSMTTDIALVSKSVTGLIRSVNIGAKSLVRVTAQNLGLDEAQADQFVRKFGLTQTKLEGQVYRSMKPLLDNVVDEIKKSIDYFYQQGNTGKIEKIVITGGPAAIPEMPVFLANALGVAVEVGNPWQKISYSNDFTDRLAGMALSYSTVVGLALRNMV
ncbi:MAG: type IV pilus assembly protein PilM [bacterium]